MGDITDSDSKLVMSIDFGIGNIIIIVDNIDSKPIAVKGGSLNSMNEYSNKEYARLESTSDRHMGEGLLRVKNNIFTIKNHKTKDIMHEVRRLVINQARANGIDI